ncbi:MAG: hypothetical protein LRY62_03760, partial [Alphaproteobacteria bacterium]|nr:hypothetical protein [Alphaproteobacteria bacterium]
ARDAAWSAFLEIPMQAVSLVMPRLDLLGQTSWLVYGGDAGNVGFIYVCAHAAVFVFLVLSASLFDLIRRQF